MYGIFEEQREGGEMKLSNFRSKMFIDRKYEKFINLLRTEIFIVQKRKNLR